MKKPLLLTVSLLLAAHPVMASHIALYSDVSGIYCSIPSGFTMSVAVIDRFATNDYGARFALDLSLAPGTEFFAVQSPYTTTGTLTTDFSVDYGQCLDGDIVIGTVAAVWAPGVASIVPAQGQANVFWTDCNFQQRVGTGGTLYIAQDCPGDDLAVEQSTWGRVKALYR